MGLTVPYTGPGGGGGGEDFCFTTSTNDPCNL